MFINDLMREDWEKLYINECKSARQLSEMFGVSHRTILNRLEKFGIKRRASGGNFRKIFVPKEILESLYVKDGLSITDIAKKFNTDFRNIKLQIESNGINLMRRCKSKRDYKVIIEDCDIDFIKDIYFNGRLSFSEIAKIYNCSVRAVYNFFKRNKLIPRTNSEAAIGKVHSDFSKEKSRNKNVLAYVNGLRTPPSCDSFERVVVSTPFQGEMTVRSSWEAAVVRYFEANKIKYFYEPDTFLVEVDGRKVSYLPDFYLPYKNLYVEVKGWEKEDGIKKFEAFKLLGYNAELWNKEVLIDLGIIDSSFKVIV